MTEKHLTCIGCPMGCQLTAHLEKGSVVSVTGNTCKHGEEYAIRECTAPTIPVTGTVAIRGAALPVLPVRTKRDVPKESVREVARAMGALVCNAPVTIGDVICPDIAGTGVALVATANAAAVQ